MEKASILIVEDDVVVSSAIEAGLQNLGYPVSAIISSGEKAIQKAGENNPDLVLMDVELEGEMDGIDTAKVIRSRFGIPVIFLTAYADEERIERAKLTMPYGYILKPFRARDLKVSIEMALYISKIEKERKQMQESLKEKSKHLERTLEATTEGIWTFNIQTNELKVSPQSYTLLGYDPYEFPSDLNNWKNLIHPDDLPLMSELIDNLKESSEAHKNAFRVRNKSGNYCWIRTRVKVVERDEYGNSVLVVGNHDDITQRKQAEDQIKNQNIFLQNLIDVLPVSIFYKNTEGIYIGCNDSYARFLGLSKDAIIGKNTYQVFPKDLAYNYSEMDKKLLKEPGIQHHESKMTYADGSRRDVLIRKVAYRNESDTVIGIIGVMVDLSSQKKAEAVLKEREELFRQLFDNMKECVAIYKPVENGRDFIFVDFNNTALLFAKKTREQILGKRVTEAFPGVIELGLLDVFRNVYKTGVSQYHPLSQYKDNSIEIWVENYVFQLPSGLIVAIYQDTSEKKKIEEELKKSEERYRALFENMGNGVAIYEVKENGKDFIFKDSNSAAEEIDRKRKEDLIGRSILEVRPGVKDFRIIEDFREVWKTGKPKRYPATFYKDDTIEGWYDNFVYKLPNNEIVAIFNDVSKQKQAEEALKESENRYRTIIENTNEGIMLQESSGRVVIWNKAAEQIFGIGMQEALEHAPIGCNWNVIREDGSSFPRSEHPSEITLSTGKPCKDVVMGFKKDSESICWISINTNPLFKENDSKPYAVVISLSDITERKKTENDFLRLSEAVRQASEAILVTKPDGRIEYANPAFEKISGYSHDEIIGLTPIIAKSKLHDESFYNNLWDTILSGKRWAGQVNNKRKDGTFYTAECSISPVKNRNGSIANLVLIIHDITKELETEKRLAQAQKMEAIGTLAGGIAHDFNNILTPIIGYAELGLLYDAPENSRMHHKLKEILTGAKRAGDLVKQILTISRQTSQKPMPIKVQPIIKEVVKLIRATLPKTIEIHHNISNECGIVMADPTQIHQIAMNLITNAYHAMEENGGELKVSLEDVELKSEDLKDPSMLPGKYACLTVEDNGTGMDKSVLERIFDPYFTTKEDGKGTGLGLAMVHSIVKNYNGDIKVYSQPGKGSAFHIYLPVSSMQEEIPKTETTMQNLRGTGHVIIVDDEEAILKMEKQMLERLGYKVTVITVGQDALETFRSNPNEFDLVITDMTMPHMTGFQLAKKLLDIRPDIPIMISTGYSAQFNQEKALPAGICDFITKPIIMKEFALKIKEVLGK